MNRRKERQGPIDSRKEIVPIKYLEVGEYSILLHFLFEGKQYNIRIVPIEDLEYSYLENLIKRKLTHRIKLEILDTGSLLNVKVHLARRSIAIPSNHTIQK